MDRLLEATYRVEQRHFWFRGFRQFVRPLLAQATAGIESPLILDCGCGTGANMVMLGEFGRTVGFDITWLGLEHARTYGERRVAQASIADIPFPASRFDLVTAFDVLYSLEETLEKRAVAELFRVLRPGGHLLVNVAALNILRGNHSVFGNELRRSTRRRLRALLQAAGFDVLRLTYTNASLFPLMLAVRTGQRLIGLATPEEAGRDLLLPPGPVNWVLTAAVSLEARALRVLDMPIGSSLLCLAKKGREQGASKGEWAE